MCLSTSYGSLEIVGSCLLAKGYWQKYRNIVLEKIQCVDNGCRLVGVCCVRQVLRSLYYHRLYYIKTPEGSP